MVVAWTEPFKRSGNRADRMAARRGRSSGGQPPANGNTPSPQDDRVLASQQWQGPLPPPGALEQFERVVEGGAERIFRMAEQEQKHRHEMEATIASSETTLEKRGQILGATLYIGGIVGAIAAVWLGAAWPVPVAMVGVTVAGVIKAIINGRRNP